MASNAPRLGGKLPRHVARSAHRNTSKALALVERFEGVSDAELAATTAEIARRVRAGSPQADDLAAVAALTSEAAFRALGQRMHPNQVLAGVVLTSGCVAELATGEGKTLAVTIPAAWLALEGRGVHLATANDYLAARDAAWMSPVYALLGLSCASVTGATSAEDRKAAYAADITYGTASEFAFDHLRDNLAMRESEIVQRPKFAIIVDEADALLIDEARTPFIISGPGASLADEWARFSAFASSLDAAQVEIRRDEHAVMLTPDGVEHAESFFDVENLYDHHLLVHHVNAALIARYLYERDRDYLVAEHDGRLQVLLVDEHTGRTLPNRRLQESIHEAIEAKEGLEVAPSTTTIASMSLQSLFGDYEFIAGTSGTAESDHEELESTYGTPVAVIPTHHPVVRIDHSDLVYATTEDKMAAITALIRERTAAGQPVLVGAPTVADADDVSAHLAAAGVAHAVLSARNPSKEAFVVAQAGRPGQVTVATNMAGRGVDIRLGGNPAALTAAELDLEHLVGAEGSRPEGFPDPETEATFDAALAEWSRRCDEDRDRVIAAGGLLVIATSRHASRRIDDQLRGRSGRQGEPGETRFYLSLEDELVRTFAGPTAGMLLARITPEPGEPIQASRLLSKVIRTAQERQESFHQEQRASVARYDSINTALRDEFYEWRHDTLTADFDELVELWFTAATAAALGPLELAEVEPDDLREALVDFLPAGVPEAAYTAPDLDSLCEVVVEAARVDLVDRYAEAPDFARDHTVRTILLNVADGGWARFLDDCETIRSGIHLRALGSRDPQQEYLREAKEHFEEICDLIAIRGVSQLMGLYVQSVETSSLTPSAQG